MFRAVPCSSLGGQIVLLQHLATVTPCKRLYSTSVESRLSLLSTDVHLEVHLAPLFTMLLVVYHVASSSVECEFFRY